VSLICCSCREREKAHRDSPSRGAGWGDGPQGRLRGAPADRFVVVVITL